MECGAQSVMTTGRLKTLKLPVGHWDYLQPVRILSLRLNIVIFIFPPYTQYACSCEELS